MLIITVDLEEQFSMEIYAKQRHKIPLVVDAENWQLCCAYSDYHNGSFFQFSCVEIVSVNIVLHVKRR
jgi:hypothetical protein